MANDKKGTFLAQPFANGMSQKRPLCHHPAVFSAGVSSSWFSVFISSEVTSAAVPS
jgi:hypothetical protein